MRSSGTCVTEPTPRTYCVLRACSARGMPSNEDASLPTPLSSRVKRGYLYRKGDGKRERERERETVKHGQDAHTIHTSTTREHRTSPPKKRSTIEKAGGSRHRRARCGPEPLTTRPKEPRTEHGTARVAWYCPICRDIFSSFERRGLQSSVWVALAVGPRARYGVPAPNVPGPGHAR